MTDFFISYNKADREWAAWIAWHLEEAGYTTIIQAWDFRPGSNFVLEMQRAATEADRVVAVLSPNYLNSRFTQPEWAAAFAQDPTGDEGRLLPVRVEECQLPGLLPQIVYIDLVGKDLKSAHSALLEGIQRRRMKPDIAPRFPGQMVSSSGGALGRTPLAGLALDSLDFGVRHNGMCVPPSEEWSTATNDPSRPTLTIALSNRSPDRSLLISCVEVRKLDRFKAIICTFPNDPDTGMMIDTYERAVDLENDEALANVVGATLALRPGESNALKLAFNGASDFCYRVQVRCLWKFLGGGPSESVLSDPYVFNFSREYTTWQDQVAAALASGEPVAAQMANGWINFNDHLASGPASQSSIRRRVLPRSSLADEFILLGAREVILTEIPPRDRWLESSHFSRRGLLTVSPEVVFRYMTQFENGEFAET